MYLLDTNTCIRFLNGSSEAVRLQLEQHPPELVCLCSVVKAELLYGAAKSANPAMASTRALKFAERFVSWPFDDSAALCYGEIRALLEKAGTPIGPNDLLIAAIASAHRAILVTHNTREFSRVPNLQLADWE